MLHKPKALYVVIIFAQSVVVKHTIRLLKSITMKLCSFQHDDGSFSYFLFCIIKKEKINFFHFKYNENKLKKKKREHGR